MYALTLVAELTGVTGLLPVDTEEDPFWYNFRVQCTSCRETHPNPIHVSRFEQNEIGGSRGEANFVWKCKNCQRESTANLIEAPKEYQHKDDSSASKPQTILKFDARGCEFVEFIPTGTWKAKGIESNTVFDNIALEDGEWYDYDEKAGEEVSIKDLKWDIRRA